ncbi:MAG: creatininase family protein [Caldilinea sp.]|nr:creatininase family protein [Caldilineaceae bacterium]MCW5841717.1 creatininase family protein [Caldilinea sp.]
MRISDMNWMQVEEYLKNDDRAVLPLGSTEQHAYLSLSVDSILAARVAEEAAEPLGVPVFPVVSYGLTPYFQSFPGTVTLRVETYMRLVRDILDSLYHSGFRRVLIVNGHGGNSPVDGLVTEWMADHPGTRVKFHNWWNAPATWAKVQEIDPMGSHASWMENFPWTRLAGVTLPDVQKIVPARPGMARLVGEEMRAFYGDGNYGGYYQRADEEMLALWDVAIAETRALLAEGWA